MAEFPSHTEEVHSSSRVSPNASPLPVNAVQPGSSESAATAGGTNSPGAGGKDTFLKWRRPGKRIRFREWYISTYCTSEHVEGIAKIQQNAILDLQFWRLYFRVWSLFADIEFFTYFIPPLMWAGWPVQAVRIVSMLFLTQYLTSCGKDLCGCPRPPCPPLRLGGNSMTYNTEYGFPSSHAAHSGVFTYFFYTIMSTYMFPTHQIACLIFAMVYFAHVAFSRIILGMHWKADLVGGWAVAVVGILAHISFLDALEAQMVASSGGFFAHVMVLVAVVFLASIHPVPHDKCPCYVDSIKFTGVMVGSFYGFWAFFRQFDTSLVRPPTVLLQDTICQWSFVKEFVLCAPTVVLMKEASAFLSKKPLQYFFKFLAGCYADKLPTVWRSPYIHFCRCIGRMVGKQLRNLNAGVTDSVVIETNPTALISPRPEREEQPHESSSQPPSEAHRRAQGQEEFSEGFVNGSQQWSLLGHKHWWLWEIYSKFVGYVMLAFGCTYVVPLILRKVFDVAHDSSGELIPRSSPPVF